MEKGKVTHIVPGPAKAVCSECGWKGMWREILRAPHPWDEDDILVGCPKCKDVNTVKEACGVAECYCPYFVATYPRGPGSGLVFCREHYDDSQWKD